MRSICNTENVLKDNALHFNFANIRHAIYPHIQYSLTSVKMMNLAIGMSKFQNIFLYHRSESLIQDYYRISTVGVLTTAVIICQKVFYCLSIVNFFAAQFKCSDF